MLVGAAAFGVALVFYSLNFYQSLEWKLWDARLRIFASPARADRNIVLVLVDQYSLDVYKAQGISWPWPRQMYAPLILYLKNGGAKACFFDIAMTEPSLYHVEDDQILAACMKDVGNVFFPVALSREEKEGSSTSESLLSRFSRPADEGRKAQENFRSITTPLDLFLKAVRGVANVQVNPDADGTYRRISLVYSYKGLNLPSVPLALAEFVQGRKDLMSVPLDSSGGMIIRFFGPTGTYRTYPAAALINSWAQIDEGKTPQIPPREFAGKIVLVGLSALGLYDIKTSPLSAVIPGTEIQAAALDTLLNRHFIRPPSKIFVLGLTLLLAVLSGIAVSSLRKIWTIVLVSIAGLAAPVAAACAGFAVGCWVEFVFPEAAVLLTLIGASILNYSLEGKQRRFIKSVFRYYLSPAVIDRILEDPDLLQLGGEKREITSFFSDVAGFTTVSEKLSPEELVHLLNDYLSEMTDIILDSGGTLDKYEGDAIVAFWNAPLDEPDHALRACRAAVACQKRLTEINPGFEKRYGHGIRMRIGLNTGPAVVGNMGSGRRFDYTAMGDTVNLAARLEGACKQYQTAILAGETTFDRVKDDIIAREADIIRVVGKKQPIKIYEIIGEKGKVRPAIMDSLDAFQKALDSYRCRDWARALELFKMQADDPLSMVYMDRCAAFERNPPLEDWDLVYDLKVK